MRGRRVETLSSPNPFLSMSQKNCNYVNFIRKNIYLQSHSDQVHNLQILSKCTYNFIYGNTKNTLFPPTVFNQLNLCFVHGFYTTYICLMYGKSNKNLCLFPTKDQAYDNALYVFYLQKFKQLIHAIPLQVHTHNLCSFIHRL